MSYTYTRTNTRANTGVSFFKPDQAIVEHTRTTYSDSTPPKLITLSLAISADALVLTRTSIFVSEAAFNEWNTDPVIVANNLLIVAHNTQNNIVESIVAG